MITVMGLWVFAPNFKRSDTLVEMFHSKSQCQLHCGCDSTSGDHGWCTKFHDERKIISIQAKLQDTENKFK